MANEADYADREPVTVIVQGEVDSEYTATVAGRDARVVVIEYGQERPYGSLAVLADKPGVEIRREPAPLSDPDLVAHALADAIMLYDLGDAGVECPSCDAASPSRCSHHAPNGPLPTAYRELLARIANEAGTR